MFEEFFGTLPILPPRSASLLPGLRVRALVPWRLLLFPLLMMGFFAVFGFVNILADPQTRLEMGKTATANGRILSKQAGTGCNRDNGKIAYVFTPPGGVDYRGTASFCGSSAYATLEPGDSVPIKYLEESPEINSIAGHDTNSPPLEIFAIFPLFFLIMFSPLYLPTVREAFRARRLVSKGLITKAEVIFAHSRNTFIWPGFPGNQSFELFVAFRTEAGASMETKVKCANIWLLQQLRVGEAVHIAYLPDRPDKAVLLEAYVR